MSKTINGTVSQFVYDGLNPVQELDGSNAVTANLLTGLGTDEYFTRTDSSGTMAFMRDALGSTVRSVGDGDPMASARISALLAPAFKVRTAVSGSRDSGWDSAKEPRQPALGSFADPR